MSRSVLLTEVDSKWIAALKRGENAGRLRQVIATSQISKSDILEGEFYLIDEFRCRLSSEGASSIFILHRFFLLMVVSFSYIFMQTIQGLDIFLSKQYRWFR